MGALSTGGRHLTASELIRRARRRLATLTPHVPDEASGVMDGDATEEDEDEDAEMLGRAYFLSTRLAGRRLLHAGLAWRAHL